MVSLSQLSGYWLVNQVRRFSARETIDLWSKNPKLKNPKT